MARPTHQRHAHLSSRKSQKLELGAHLQGRSGIESRPVRQRVTAQPRMRQVSRVSSRRKPTVTELFMVRHRAERPLRHNEPVCAYLRVSRPGLLAGNLSSSAGSTRRTAASLPTIFKLA